VIGVPACTFVGAILRKTDIFIWRRILSDLRFKWIK
jgi:hypothetical protein